MLFCVYKMMSGSQVADNDTYGLLVRRTFTILQNIRISSDCCSTFMRIFLPWYYKIHITTFGEVLKA